MSSNSAAYHSLFDKQAAAYSKFRPTYTPALYDTILSFARLKQHSTCLDVATGQGQAAVYLATIFDKVIAIDANERQLQFAAERSNVVYRAADCHDTGVDEGTIDLVTVGQAMHWFDLERFYQEAVRVLKPAGCLACWGYDLCTFPGSDEATQLVDNLCNVTLGPYWADRRALVANHYDGLAPGPQLFSEVRHIPHFPIKTTVSISGVVGYVTSWSAYITFCKEHLEEGAAIPEELEAGLLRCFGTQDRLQEVEVVTDFMIILARDPVKGPR